MIITSLVDNLPSPDGKLEGEHGLSLLVETGRGLRILFDTGQSDLFLRNARKLGKDLSGVDLLVISHGHYDHGGGLRAFLEANHKAPVLIQRDAFRKRFSVRQDGIREIGLEGDLAASPRIRFLDGVAWPLEGLTVLTQNGGTYPLAPSNQSLRSPSPEVQDLFPDEQSLLVEEDGKRVLIAGCAHRGILNIIARCAELPCGAPTHVLGGMHLSGIVPGAAQSKEYALNLARELTRLSGMLFWTMHCTGTEGFQILQRALGRRIQYLRTGDRLQL